MRRLTVARAPLQFAQRRRVFQLVVLGQLKSIEIKKISYHSPPPQIVMAHGLIMNTKTISFQKKTTGEYLYDFR